MEWKDLLGELVALVQQTAPELWRIARRQVLANIVSLAMWGLFTLCGTVGAGLLTRYGFRKVDTYDRDEVLVPSIASGVLFLVLTVAIVVGIVSRLINPDYYAIAVLMNLVK